MILEQIKYYKLHRRNYISLFLDNHRDTPFWKRQELLFMKACLDNIYTLIPAGKVNLLRVIRNEREMVRKKLDSEPRSI